MMKHAGMLDDSSSLGFTESESLKEQRAIEEESVDKVNPLRPSSVTKKSASSGLNSYDDDDFDSSTSKKLESSLPK